MTQQRVRPHVDITGVITSEAKHSIGQQNVWIATSLTLLAMTAALGELYLSTFAAVSCTDSPQPQAPVWFGLLKMNCADILSAL